MVKLLRKNDLILILGFLLLNNISVRSEITESPYRSSKEDMGFKRILWAENIPFKDKSIGKDISLFIKSPSTRSVDPNTFPSFSFVVFNDSKVDLPLDFEVIKPPDWELLTFHSTHLVKAQKNEKVRITIAVPKSVTADRVYYLGLITRWESFADTSVAQIKINQKHAIKLLSFTEDKFVSPGEVETQSYIFKNEGNVIDTIYLDAQLPSTWNLVDLDHRIVLWPRESSVARLQYRVSETAPARSSNLIHLKASLKREKIEDLLFQWSDSQPFTQGEIEILNLLFRASQKMGYETRALITVSETSMARQEKDGLEAITRVTVLPARKRISKSLSPIFPVSIGLIANRLEKDRYPNMALYVRTGVVDMGNYTAQMEFTQRSYSALVGQEITNFTDQYKVHLQGKQWSMTSGDVVLRENPLLSYRSSLSNYDLQPLGDLSRGFQVRYRFNENANFHFFRGKRIFRDETFTNAELGFRFSNDLNGSTAYTNRDSSQIITMGTEYHASSNFYISMLGGFSLPGKSGTPSSNAMQFRSHFKTKSIQILGCAHWAEPLFKSADQGKSGVVVNAQWNPMSSFNFWGSYHVYKQDWLTSENDSSANILEFKTRSMFKLGKRISLHGGYEQSDMKFMDGRRLLLTKKDIQFYQYWRIGLPILGCRIADTYYPYYDQIKTQYEYQASWISYLKRLRVRVERRWMRIDESPFGTVDGFDVDFGFRNISLGFFMKNGKVWQIDWENGFSEKNVSSVGIRSQFEIHPFGKNYQVIFELGKYTSETSDYEENWKVWVSFCANTIPRFDVPLPFLKTKGRVHGEVFLDRNMNGIRDPDEPGVPQIMLFMESEDAITDNEGQFEFQAMEIGEYPFYIDRVTLPAYLNLIQEPPSTISLQKGSVIFLHIPVTSICSLNGTVFLDQNHNSRQDMDESVMPRVKLVIQNDQNQRWEIYTDQEGNFELTDLLPGYYSITIDSDWLPERVIPKQKEFNIVLTPNEPQITTNLAVVRKELLIKKTFIAPPKIKTLFK